jgi:disulfide bond formation protein DsbB
MFSILTVLGQVIVVALVILALVYKKQTNNKILNFVSSHGLFFAFIVALIATCGSLFYSEFAFLTPCKLCWFQRIFLYPQVILLGLATLRRDKNIIPYSISMAVIGAGIALYNYLLQWGLFAPGSCSVNAAEDCSQRIFFNFGYISISTMALTAFLLIIVFLTIKKRQNI